MKTIKLIALFAVGFIIGMVAYNTKAAEQGMNNIPLSSSPKIGVTLDTQALTQALLKGFNMSAETDMGKWDDLSARVSSGRLEATIAYNAVGLVKPLWNSHQTVSSTVICWDPSVPKYGNQKVILTYSTSSAARWDGFRDFVMSDQGQAIVKAMGFVPTRFSDRR